MCNAAWHGATDPVTVRCAAVLYSTLHVPGRGLTVHMCSVHRLYSPGHCTRCGIWSLLLWHSPARVAALVSSLEYNSAISFQSWEEIIPIISRVSCVGLPSQLTDFLWLLMIQYSLCQRVFAKQSLNKLSPPKNGTDTCPHPQVGSTYYKVSLVEISSGQVSQLQDETYSILAKIH